VRGCVGYCQFGRRRSEEYAHGRCVVDRTGHIRRRPWSLRVAPSRTRRVESSRIRTRCCRRRRAVLLSWRHCRFEQQ
jgi:hypothetical protein